jgi:hypothetical protein
LSEDIVPSLRNLHTSQNQSIKQTLDECKRWDRDIQELLGNLNRVIYAKNKDINLLSIKKARI